MTAKRVTSQDVAELAGVSRTTVSMVLNHIPGIQISEETRQRVFAAALELNYVPNAAAQALASRSSRIIGLILTRDPHHIASDAFITQVLDGLVQVSHRHGLRLLIDIVAAEHQKQAYLELVRAQRIDGILLSGPRFDDDALRTLHEHGFPTVLVGQVPGSQFYSVDVDNRSAARQAVDHLIRLGHRRIACITNAPITYTAASDRLAGYRDALEAAGLLYDESLVRYGDFDPDSGYLQMLDILNLDPRPSAVFVASDVVAFGAQAAIRERGLRIPGDIALVGFDDVPLARFVDPPLTTIRLPAVELARRASEMLIGLIQGDHPAQKNVLLGTSLVIRASCGAQGRVSPT